MAARPGGARVRDDAVAARARSRSPRFGRWPRERPSPAPATERSSHDLTVRGLARTLKHVLDQADPLDRVFQALADPSRRLMVERLSRGPASVSELARPFSMSLAAVVQHVQVLEACGLVRSEKVGRVRTCQIAPATLRPPSGGSPSAAARGSAGSTPSATTWPSTPTRPSPTAGRARPVARPSPAPPIQTRPIRTRPIQTKGASDDRLRHPRHVRPGAHLRRVARAGVRGVGHAAGQGPLVRRPRRVGALGPRAGLPHRWQGARERRRARWPACTPSTPSTRTSSPTSASSPPTRCTWTPRSCRSPWPPSRWSRAARRPSSPTPSRAPSSTTSTPSAAREEGTAGLLDNLGRELARTTAST